jgi:hypothetical protein
MNLTRSSSLTDLLCRALPLPDSPAPLSVNDEISFAQLALSKWRISWKHTKYFVTPPHCEPDSLTDLRSFHLGQLDYGPYATSPAMTAHRAASPLRRMTITLVSGTESCQRRREGMRTLYHCSVDLTKYGMWSDDNASQLCIFRVEVSKTSLASFWCETWQRRLPRRRFSAFQRVSPGIGAQPARFAPKTS